jgi:Uma2 family endonuclease
MNIRHQPQTAKPEPAQRFVLYGVGWEGYEKILEVIGERHVRVTYDRGDLELMSPLSPHEIYKKFFGRLLDVLAEELDIRVMGCGSTTFRRQDLDRGLEPDECFYLSSAARVRDWSVLDLATDPPPDLAVEIDITASCLDRMGVYAGLGVPELWRFDGTTLEVFLLGAGGEYQPSPGSRALPFVPLGEVVPLLHRSLEVGDDGQTLRSLRAWVRDRVVPAFQAGAGAQHPPEGNG